MPVNQKIHAFALKYLNLFSSPYTQEREVIGGFDDLCFSIGFKMDCGEAFEAAYPKASFEVDELKRIIAQVDDIYFLGSAIFSRWRYYTYWALPGTSILEENARAWFIPALKRLALLTTKHYPAFFEGTLQRFRLISNIVGMGPFPGPEDEVEQRLTIRDNGHVWLTRYYGFSTADKSHHTQQFAIDKRAASIIFRAVSYFFRKPYKEIFVTNNGNWKLELTNTKGGVFEYSGSLCTEFDLAGIDLSDLIRSVLENKALYVFDGRPTLEYIFCSVVFDQGGKSYYYLTDDQDLQIGDQVLVPAGKANQTAEAEIIAIKTFTEETAPFPVDKTKWILRKLDN